jgi:hypothetical protein
MPVLPGGRIPVDQALQWMEDNLDPLKRAAARMESDNPPTLVEAKRMHELVKVQRARLALERERGELVDRASTMKMIFARARAERDSHLAWVHQVTPLLSAETGADPHIIFATLDRLMREHLEHLADTPLADLDRASRS